MTRLSMLAAMAAALLVVGCGGSSSGSIGFGASDPAGGLDDSARVPDIDAPPVAAPYANYGAVLNILPPGQDDNGGLTHANLPLPLPAGQLGDLVNQVSAATGLVPALETGSHFNDQLGMYAALIHAEPGLTNPELVPQYFKRETLRAPDDGPWESQRTITDGQYQVVIKRDGYGVPHIYGDTREDALFGTGYASAHDRLFLMDVLRRAGRGKLSAFLGPADFSFDQDIALKAPYRESDRTQQIQDVVDKFGAAGEQVFRDVTAYVAGINAYVAKVRSGVQALDTLTTEAPIEYLALGLPLTDFTVEDVQAVATLIQAIFAAGGGGEAANLRLLYALQGETGDAQTACKLWRDIRNALDPASAVTTTRRFATQSPRDYNDDICPLLPKFQAQYPGNALFDPGSYVAHDSFMAEPCGQPGQPACPGGLTGALPQLPASAPVFDILDSVLAPLGLATENSAAEEESAVQKVALARQHVAKTIAMLTGLGLELPRQISNALLVSGAHTASGHPIAVFGPQTSYFEPQLLVELAVNVRGGSLHTRGMTFAGLPYVVIGRGVDFAWSATSGNSDLIDVFVVKTCTADQPRAGSDPAPAGVPTGYLHNGACLPFDFIIQSWPARWNLSVVGKIPPGQNYKATRRIIRTKQYGPVFAFATVNGTPVALTRKRSTYRGELDTVVPFFLATRNDVYDAESFQKVFNTTTGTFNWFYIDDEDIAYIHSGRYPVRANGVHPDMPTWGTGQYDWQGFIGLERHPQVINPERGYLASWNNRPARGWWAADANASYGPTHRVEALTTRLEDLVAQGNVTRANVVEAMADAATVDIRGQEVLPPALDLLAQGALTADQQEAVSLLRDWVAHGAMRRDRDGNGEYDRAAAVALMNTWYDLMIEAVLPQIVAVEDRMIMPRGNPPGPKGSAYQKGYYGYLERVFRMALGRAQKRYQVLACSGATPDAGDCRAALKQSLDQALAALGGIDNRANWDAKEARDRIEHRPLGLSAVRPIDWQNRPTFQQVVQFRTGR